MSMPPQFLADAIKENYRAWNIPEHFLEHDTTAQSLAQILEAAEPRLQETNYRLFPTSFDGNDMNARAFPRPIFWVWESAERLLRFFGARAVMTRVPHFWQLESPVHTICRNIRAPLFTNEVENIPLGAAAIASAQIDTVITGALDAAAFSSYLLEKNLPQPAWILIHEANADWTVPAALLQSNRGVGQEVHLFPGLPLLWQCPALAQKKTAEFHLNDAYLWDIEDTRTRIISLGADPLPLYRYVLPCMLHIVGTCACGRVIVEKKA